MGRSGTDVAREAADLVLLDDDFATIVAAIEQGRATFANIRRFLTYHLTDNVAELTPFVVWALSGGRVPLGDRRPADPRARHRHRPAARPGARRRAAHAGPARRATDAPAPHRPRRPASGVRRARAGRGRRLDGRLLRRLRSPPAGGRATAFPTGHTLAGGVGRRVRRRGARPDRQRVRLPQRDGRWPGAPAGRTNRLLLVAVAVELALLVAFLWVPAIADLLGQAPPSTGASLWRSSASPPCWPRTPRTSGYGEDLRDREQGPSQLFVEVKCGQFDMKAVHTAPGEAAGRIAGPVLSWGRECTVPPTTAVAPTTTAPPVRVAPATVPAAPLPPTGPRPAVPWPWAAGMLAVGAAAVIVSRLARRNAT